MLFIKKARMLKLADRMEVSLPLMAFPAPEFPAFPWDMGLIPVIASITPVFLADCACCLMFRAKKWHVFNIVSQANLLLETTVKVLVSGKLELKLFLGVFQHITLFFFIGFDNSLLFVVGEYFI